jgi:hypothetical protein
MKFKLTGIYCVACLLAAGCDGMITPVKEEAKKQAAEQAEQAKAEAAPKKDPKGILNKTTTKVVDAKKALAENPNLAIVEPGELGNNYLSQLANARVMIPAQVSQMNLKHAMDLHQATNGKYPSYDEFLEIMKRDGYKLTEVYRWQMYGYNEDDGSVVLFTDEALKKKIYDENGLDYERAELK